MYMLAGIGVKLATVEIIKEMISFFQLISQVHAQVGSKVHVGSFLEQWLVTEPISF